MIKAQVSLNQLRAILDPLTYHQELSWKETLEYWCEKIIIRHFQPGNETAYDYPKLSHKYLQRKIKKWGNQPMLVASGTLREAVISMYKVYKIRNKFRVVLNIPSYGKYVKEFRDFTIVNKRDRRDLSRYYKSNLTKRRRLFVNQIRMTRR